MRFQPLALLLPSLFLSSCAYEGVIVRKDSAPLPFYESVGVDGSYKLALRDSSGAVHSQLVTPEVFESHGEGDYFNDLQPAPSTASAAAKGMAAAGSAAATTNRSLALGRGNLGNGNRFAAKTIGSAQRSTVARVQPHAAVQPALASAHRASAPIHPAALKVQSPAVTAHFSVAMNAPAPAPQTASTAYVVAAKPPVAVAPHAHTVISHHPAQKAHAVSVSKRKHQDPSRSAHALKSAQIPLVR